MRLQSCPAVLQCSPECGRCKLVKHGRVTSRIIIIAVALGPDTEVVQVHGVQSDYPRKELVVGDVLECGAHHTPTLLVKPLIAPVGVDLGTIIVNKCIFGNVPIYPGQLVHHPVVFSEEDGVHGGQSGLLASPDVPRHEALPGLGLALLVGVRCRHHHLAAPVGRQSGVEPTTTELPQTVCLADVLAVDLTGVHKGRVLVELLPGPEPLLARQGACEGDAVRPARGDIQGGEVGVIAGHGDGPTLRVHSLGGVASPDIRDG